MNSAGHTQSSLIALTESSRNFGNSSLKRLEVIGANVRHPFDRVCAIGERPFNQRCKWMSDNRHGVEHFEQSRNEGALESV